MKPETIESYFYDQIQGHPLDGDVKAYLVMTLTRWAVSEPDTSKSLSIEFMEAHHEGGWRFRDVGDKALYLSSVRSLDRRRAVSLRFYEDLGVSSYSKFAEYTNSRSFLELAHCFQEAAVLISDIFAAPNLQTLVARAQAGSGVHEDQLARMGVLILKRDS